MRRIKNILFLLIILFSGIANGQSTFSLEVMTLGLHAFEKPNLALFENALDQDGNFSAEPGLAISYETFVRDNWASFQLTTSIFSDAAGQMAGFTEISFRLMFFHKWRSSLYLSAGPALTYRDSWSRLSYGNIVYNPETKYYNEGKWEILPSLVGKLEYDIFLGRKSDVLIGIYYGHSYHAFTATLGYRYWFSTKVKHTRKCDCKDKYRKKFSDWFR